MSSLHDTSKSTIESELRSPKDWSNWEATFLLKANGHEILRQVKKQQPWLVEPVMPLIEKAKYEKQRALIQPEQSQTETLPSQVTANDDASIPESEKIQYKIWREIMMLKKSFAPFIICLALDDVQIMS